MQCKTLCPLCANSGHRPSLFDHFVCAGKERRWHGEAKRFGGLEVDHQLVLGRRLHRKLARLLASEDAVDIASRLPEPVVRIGPVGDQAAAGAELAYGVDRRQTMTGRQRDDQVAMNYRQRARRHDQAVIRPAREGRDGALDLAGVVHINRVQLDAKRRRHGLDGAELADPAGVAGIPKDRHARYAWRDLFEQLQPFRADGIRTVGTR